MIVFRLAYFSSLLIIMVLCSACWGSVAIERNAFVLGVAIDKAEQEGQIEVTAFMPIPTLLQEGGGDEKPYHSVSEMGRTMHEVLGKIQRKIDKRINLGHLRLILLGEDFARSDLGAIFDEIREHDIGRDTQLFVTKGKAKDVLALEPGFANNIVEYILYWINPVSVNDLKHSLDIGLYYVQEAIIGKVPALPYVTPAPESEEGMVEFIGIAPVKDDKMVGSLDITESKGFIVTIGRRGAGAVTVENVSKSQPRTTVQPGSANTYSTVELVNIGSKLDVLVAEGISGKVSIEATFDVIEYTGSKEVREAMSEIKTAVEHQVQNDIKQSIAQAQSLNTDIFGFGRILYTKDHKTWRKLNWDEVFPTMPVEVSVTLKSKKTATD